MAEGLWLEVSNVKITGDTDIQVQVRGDKTSDKNPEWHSVPPCGDAKTCMERFKLIVDALEKKRIVLVRFGAAKTGKLVVINDLTIQYGESAR